MDTYEQQANLFAKKHQIRLTSRYIGCEPNLSWGTDNMHHWKCKLMRNGKSYNFDFWTGLGKGEAKPTKYDVFSCLMKSDVGTFSEFCDEYGYNGLPLSEHDRIKKIYLSCKKEYLAVLKLFGDCMEEFCQIN